MPFASDLKKQEFAGWWSDDRNTLGTPLLAMFIDQYGTEALSWEPRTIREQLQADYGITIPDAVFDRLMAMITLYTTNGFWVLPETFTLVANALNGSEVDPSEMDPVEAHEAAWALTEALLNDPVKSDDELLERLSEDVRTYLGVITVEEGLVTLPDILRVASVPPSLQKLSAEMTFADDPQMFQAAQQLSRAKGIAIQEYVRDMLTEMISQLDSIPLQTRNDKRWEAFAARARRAGLEAVTAP